MEKIKLKERSVCVHMRPSTREKEENEGKEKIDSGEGDGLFVGHHVRRVKGEKVLLAAV